MTYTTKVNENAIIEIYKNETLFDRLGPWTDVATAEKEAELLPLRMEERDIEIQNGERILKEYKQDLLISLEELMLPPSIKNSILKII